MWSSMNSFEPRIDAAEAAPLAVDVLGRRIDDAVGAELQRALQERRREDVVDDERRAGRVGDLGHGGDVDELERRVGRALEEERLGVRAARRRARRRGRVPSTSVEATPKRGRSSSTT